MIMTNEKAIEILKSRLDYVAEINIDAIIAYNLAIKALEKQIPQNPIKDDEFLYCPNCEVELNDPYEEYYKDGIENEFCSFSIFSKYCDCGQRIKL